MHRGVWISETKSTVAFFMFVEVLPNFRVWYILWLQFCHGNLLLPRYLFLSESSLYLIQKCWYLFHLDTYMPRDFICTRMFFSLKQYRCKQQETHSSVARTSKCQLHRNRCSALFCKSFKINGSGRCNVTLYSNGILSVKWKDVIKKTIKNWLLLMQFRSFSQGTNSDCRYCHVTECRQIYLLSKCKKL